VLGGYVIERELARGGMGTVYRARDHALERPVALKVIAAAHSADRRFRDRFRAECHLAARIEHPGVLPIFRSGQDRGRLFFAMRFVEGEDLAAVLRRGPLDPERAVAIVGQIAGALDAAHAAGLVHRDVKPANVLLDGDHAYLTDFGVAVEPHGDIRLTSTGQWVGTLAYAAPEQIRGGTIDARADVYALGGLLHHCLTGELPFPAADELAVISAHLVEPRPRPSRVNPAVSRAFDDVVGRAMSTDPAHRFASAGAMAAAAAAALAGTALPSLRPEGQPLPWEPCAGLPDQPTALIGRRRELEQLLALVPERRLVSLTGPGGAGKTRLAVQVAAVLADAFADGVAFIPLAAVTDPALVKGAIARALGLTEAELSAGLGERLLVIDNAEQVVAGAAEELAALLAVAPRLHVLVTSRIRLDLREEQEFRLEPLDTADAVVLFTQAARRVRPAFEPDHHVDELVRRLDGLPLAVELAASRIRVLTAQQISERLGEGLDLLSTGARDVPPRQRTLRATIEWSHALLEPRERGLLAGLSVFAGSFDFEAAGAVCDADIDGIEALVDNSLLRETGTGRFFLLDTIRAFAAEQLAADSRLDGERRRRHLAHYAALVRGGRPPGEQAEAWIASVRRELPNLRAALETASRTDHELLARLVADLLWGWTVLGHMHEYGEWVARAREPEPADPAVRLELISAAGQVAYHAGDVTGSIDLYTRAMELAQTLGDRRAELVARTRRCASAMLVDDLDAAELDLREALAGADELGDEGMRARITANLGAVALIRRDFAAALRLGEDAAAALRELREPHLAAQALTNAGLAAVCHGRPDLATPHLLEALEICRRMGHQEGTAYVFIGAGAVIAGAGDGRTAALLLGKARAILDENEFFLQPFEQEVADEALATARAALGPDRVDRALAEGAELDDAQACELVATGCRDYAVSVTAIRTARP
jgi:non-specific serine/threonine protein kinase